MSSFVKVVSAIVLSGAACFAAGCAAPSGDDNLDDEDVSDAAQGLGQAQYGIGQAEYGIGQAQGVGPGLDQPGSSILGPGAPPAPDTFSKFSKFTKKAPPPQSEFSKFTKKAPPPLQNPPFQSSPGQ
jgi:opacity protein-like surface antigen